MCLPMFSFAKSESKCLKIVRKEKSSKHQKEAKKKDIYLCRRLYALRAESIKMIKHSCEWRGAMANLLADFKP